MADTRKDKRAPVSLKVRFKSATVDEFIEHYSKDVSRGGIYIKSSNPMAVGTLLKFQFQLKDESALIKGVGRVVWTRAEVDATSDSPAGMGIKFIKMDNESRSMVERIVDVNAPDPGSYVSGRVSATSAEPTSSAPPPGGGGFFPDLPPAELPAPEDRTAVRHATQFLADALKEGNDEAAAAEAALEAEQAKRRQDEVDAERKAEAAKALQPSEPEQEATPAVSEPPAEEAASKSPLPSMIIDPSLEPRTGRPSEIARETDITPVPRPIAALGKPSADDSSEPDTEPPPPAPPARRPTTSIPPTGEKPRSALPMIAIAIVIAVAAFVALRGGPEEKPVEEPAAAPLAPEPAKVEEPAPAAEEKSAEPATPVEELTEDAAVSAEEKHEVSGVELARVAVKVVASPVEAEVYVDGVRKGEGTVSLELPVGTESTVSARAKGFVEASTTVTPVEGKKVPAIQLKLKPFPFIVHVETTPPGAAINVAGVKGVTPADLTLDRAPTQELSVTAKLDGYERALTRIPPSAFSEVDSAMRTQLNLTLKAKLPEETSKEVTPPEPALKKPGKKVAPRSNAPTAKPIEGATELPKAEQPAATPPSPEPAAPEPPKPEEPKKEEPLPGNPFGN